MIRKKSKFSRNNNSIQRLGVWLKRELAEYTIFLSIIILFVGIFISAAIYLLIPESRDGLFSGIFVEFNGMLFDVIVFGIVVAGFIRVMERRQEIQRQQEIIDDYKKWDSDEGKLRIAGAVRRLNRSGKTNIDFGGIEITDFSFRRHDIKSIRGSTFYDGTWGEMGSRDNVKLERVSFSQVDCREVVFSKFHPFAGIAPNFIFASIRDCYFSDADLSKAVFNGAHLEWTMEHPDELGVWHHSPGEQPSFQQTHYPPFSNATLKGVSFVDVTFKNADFRDADGILECDFSGAKGLESCLFDDERTKDLVLKMSQKKK